LARVKSSDKSATDGEGEDDSLTDSEIDWLRLSLTDCERDWLTDSETDSLTLSLVEGVEASAAIYPK